MGDKKHAYWDFDWAKGLGGMMYSTIHMRCSACGGHGFPWRDKTCPTCGAVMDKKPPWAM